MGTKVVDGDEVCVNDLFLLIKPLYICFHKPVGIVCTTDIEDNIIDYIGYQRGTYWPRLDKPSEET
jgi:23S rRNA pseudouridine2604 synthase